jgi:hypothetical protein
MNVNVETYVNHEEGAQCSNMQVARGKRTEKKEKRKRKEKKRKRKKGKECGRASSRPMLSHGPPTP